MNLEQIDVEMLVEIEDWLRQLESMSKEEFDAADVRSITGTYADALAAILDSEPAPELADDF